MSKQLQLIVNPHSGAGRAGRIAGRVQQLLAEQGFDLSARLLSDRDEIAAAAAQAAAVGSGVAVVGGDGIVGAAAEGLRSAPEGACLGIVPAGRGNDLARALGIPQDVQAACEVIAAGHCRCLDLGEVNGRVFVGIASVGFDSEANRVANAAPAWLGRFSYLYGAIVALARWRCAGFSLAQLEPEQTAAASRSAPPTEVMRFQGFSVSLANSPYFGGGMMLAPMAQLDDGLLDMVAITRMSKLMFALRAPLVFSGRHIGLGVVRSQPCRAMRIEADRPMVMYADGDAIGPLPVEVRVLPAALTVFAPAAGSEHRPRLSAGSAEGAGPQAQPVSAAGAAPVDDRLGAPPQCT